MLKYLALTLLLLGLVTYATCQSSRRRGKARPGGQPGFMKINDTRFCNQYMFKDCCTMPKLIPREVFEGCMGTGSPVADKMEFKGTKGTKGAPARKTRAAQEGPADKKKAKGHRGADGKGGGPMCIMRCVMLNQSMINENNDLDVAVIKERFLANSEEEWKSRVSEAADNCSLGIAGVDLATTPAPPAHIKNPCNAKAGFFMTCMRQQLTINCLDAMKSNDTNKKCESNVEGLKNCDPFFLPPPPGRGGNKPAGGRPDGKGEGKQGGEKDEGKSGGKDRAKGAKGGKGDKEGKAMKSGPAGSSKKGALKDAKKNKKPQADPSA